MKIGIVGGGSWGTTLGQVLVDNNHEVLVYDINEKTVDMINSIHRHPFFDTTISYKIKATSSLVDTINFSDYILLSVPTKAMRSVLVQIKSLTSDKKVFINVSKGIEPETSLTMSQIADEVLGDQIEAFITLAGPSHAEEVILRKLTALVSASTSEYYSKIIQKMFSNDQYIRVYTSTDIIGVEVCGAVKNAIALVSGIATGIGLGENARAALISRGVIEINSVVEVLGGRKETVFGLTGIGDLMVTASSMNSRNFQAGLKIGQGVPLDNVISNSMMVVEGARTIISTYEISKKYNLELPIISLAYAVLYNDLPINEALPKLLRRKLKSELF